ncbi:MAG: hydrogenase nickel incorporation protein HypB [Gammaproteobacteria bacterium]|nr:hydrogenase nickel incorporation protein HypB [Gammaproteobacteria bacterium]
MCLTCGCALAPPKAHLHLTEGTTLMPVEPPPNAESLRLGIALQAENDQRAADNRRRFSAAGILVINLMSSPGAGKTRLLEQVLPRLAPLRCAVLEGDLETDLDAQRIRRHGIPAVQITTGGACHLDARLIEQALTHLDLQTIDLLFIENVGNLVCPASFDLGQHHNVVLLAVTEGDDKPAKYPVMFLAADLVLLSKVDLLPWLDDFDPDRAQSALRDLASQAPVMAVSAKSGAGLEDWIAWIHRAHKALIS